MRAWGVAAAVVVLNSAACASSPDRPEGGLAAVAPMLSVERFLQAVNIGDLEAMSRLFGNQDGSIAERSGGSFSCAFKRMGSWIGLGSRCLDRTEIELRMNAIALIVRIASPRSVPFDRYSRPAETAMVSGRPGWSMKSIPGYSPRRNCCAFARWSKWSFGKLG